MNQALTFGDNLLETCRNAARQLTARQENPSAHRVELQDIYLDVLNSGRAQEAAHQANRLFTAVMQLTPDDQPALRRFIHGWGNTHMSSDLVGRLAIRLHEAGADRAAAKMMYVIADDIGASGKPHRDMFATFANALCSPESWRSEKNKVPACTQFRSYLVEARIDNSIEEGILTTAASEIWNVGEYTSLNAPVFDWMCGPMNLPRYEAAKANAYIRVHGGDVELNHFLHAIDAWDIYAEHTGKAQPAEDAAYCIERYLQEVGKAYGGLADDIHLQRMVDRQQAALAPAI